MHQDGVCVMVTIHCHIDTLPRFVADPLDLQVFCSLKDLIDHSLGITVLRGIREGVGLALMQWPKGVKVEVLVVSFINFQVLLTALLNYCCLKFTFATLFEKGVEFFFSILVLQIVLLYDFRMERELSHMAWVLFVVRLRVSENGLSTAIIILNCFVINQNGVVGDAVVLGLHQRFRHILEVALMRRTLHLLGPRRLDPAIIVFFLVTFQCRHLIREPTIMDSLPLLRNTLQGAVHLTSIYSWSAAGA